MNTLLGTPHTLSQFWQAKHKGKKSARATRFIASRTQEMPKSKQALPSFNLFHHTLCFRSINSFGFLNSLVDNLFKEENLCIFHSEIGVINSSNEMRPGGNLNLIPHLTLFWVEMKMHAEKKRSLSKHNSKSRFLPIGQYGAIPDFTTTLELYFF